MCCLINKNKNHYYNNNKNSYYNNSNMNAEQDIGIFIVNFVS